MFGNSFRTPVLLKVLTNLREPSYKQTFLFCSEIHVNKLTKYLHKSSCVLRAPHTRARDVPFPEFQVNFGVVAKATTKSNMAAGDVQTTEPNVVFTVYMAGKM